MNVKHMTWKSFQHHFSSWKHISLFEKSFFVSLIMTCVAFLLATLPATRPNPGDFSNEFSPQIIESAFLVWIAPLGYFGIFLMRIGLYPGNGQGGLWGGMWTLAIVNTFFWAFIFWLGARAVRFVQSKRTSLKK